MKNSKYMYNYVCRSQKKHGYGNGYNFSRFIKLYISYAIILAYLVMPNNCTRSMAALLDLSTMVHFFHE